VDGGLNKHTDPVTVPADYYELISDSVFGKVVRYKGGPWANTTRISTVLGAVATHVVKFPDIRNVWVRQFVRFSPNYWPRGATPAGHNDSYKLMFLRWDGAGFREAVTFSGAWRIAPEYGQGGSGGSVWPGSETPVATPTPPDGGFANQYDIHSIFRRSYPTSQMGDGQWYEIVMGHLELAPLTGRGIIAWRKYTVADVVNPQAWTVYIVDRTHTDSTKPWVPANRYDMGVNRNKSFDEDMTWDWGPYDIVDGSRFPNPFKIPYVP
jgi:hypothetical protein